MARISCSQVPSWVKSRESRGRACTSPLRHLNRLHPAPGRVCELLELTGILGVYAVVHNRRMRSPSPVRSGFYAIARAGAENMSLGILLRGSRESSLPGIQHPLYIILSGSRFGLNQCHVSRVTGMRRMHQRRRA